MATAAAVNESRGDLLNWVNELLQLNITKIEQVGTGAVLCQIMDSIFGDVQLHKVKFQTNQEYEYVNNYKVLQACFTRHNIDKFIPVDRLMKLKFQDNLEFLQWMKKFWDTHYPGGKYDAISRRKGTGNITTTAPMGRASLTNVGSMAAIPPTKISSLPPQRAASPPQTSSSTVSQLQHQISLLNKTITELRISVDEMEKERDFYFNKLREIEAETQKVTEKHLLDSGLFRQITEILYKTEDGFEIPNDQ